MTGERCEPGSFRDANNVVFYRDGVVLRALSREALVNWEALSSTRFFVRLLAERKVVKTELLEDAGALPPSPPGGWAGVLRHEAVPFVSYPYEWSFAQLKDAALLTTEIILAALEENMILKDSSAFNVQWDGVRPVFIDIPSFVKLEAGEPWVGYRQFCQMFLYPLLVEAYRGVPFQSWMRGSIDGIEAAHCRRMMSLWDMFRPGVFTHVYLQDRMQEGFEATRHDVKADVRAAGFKREMIVSNVRRLGALIRGLSSRSADSHWVRYTYDERYGDSAQERKVEFVRSAMRSGPWRTVWDLGCNTGFYSRIAAENARCVVAMDSDHAVIGRMYRDLKTEGNSSILPLVNDIADPSPGLGWRGVERKVLADRGRPDLVFCLALIHHVRIGANIPLGEFVRWIAELGAALVIEFVTKDDPQARRLLRNKEDIYADYETSNFEKLISGLFHIERREPLPGGTRIMYFVKLKDGRATRQIRKDD